MTRVSLGRLIVQEREAQVSLVHGTHAKVGAGCTPWFGTAWVLVVEHATRSSFPVLTVERMRELWDRVHPNASHPPDLIARTTDLIASKARQLGTLAGLHHERLDGSGYRGTSAAAQPLAARILAAADAYQTKRERRPHRPADAPEEAATHLRTEADIDRLDAEVVDALLVAAGRRPTPGPSQAPAPLSQREVEVLRLLARGLANREMAEILVISPKTVGHHVQHIYDKLGISTRVGATLFALQHGIVDEETETTPK